MGHPKPIKTVIIQKNPKILRILQYHVILKVRLVFQRGFGATV